MTSFVAGYVDEEISFCPYCGERLEYISCIGDTVCGSCGKSFCVIEGENDEGNIV